MNLPDTIDVALGLVVLYLLLSTVCSILVELLATWRGWRGKMLLESINRLLVGPCAGSDPASLDPIVRDFWAHPLVRPLIKPGELAPSYMESKTFAAVVLDIGLPKTVDGQIPSSPAAIERALTLAREATPGRPDSGTCLGEQLLALIRVRRLWAPGTRSDNDVLPQMHAAISTWYNEGMDRLTGEYKRRSQEWLFWLGLGTALLLNADSIRLAYVLGTDDRLREVVAAYAITLTDTNIPPEVTPVPVGTNLPAATPGPPAGTPSGSDTPDDSGNQVGALRQELAGQIREMQQLQAIGFPIGWQFQAVTDFAPLVKADDQRIAEGQRGGLAGVVWGLVIVLVKLTGLAVTGLAVSLGAPFWYDILNKLVSLRGAGRRPSTTPAVESPGSPTGSGSAGGTTGAPVSTSPALVGTASGVPDIGVDLARPEIAFCPRKGLWLAEAAKLAYETGLAALQARVQRDWFLPHVEVFDDGRCTQAFLAVGPRVAILAFRGTEPREWQDWLTDARFKPVQWDDGMGRVHGGFAGALAGCAPAIVEAVNRLKGSGRLLYLTGHSLGGSLATLMAARLATQRIYPVQGVFTFGSPRVGDPAFAEAYGRLLGDRTFRFVNHEDLVTRLPTRSLGFKHVGEIAYFDVDGRLQRDVGYWYRFLNLVANAVEDYRQAAKTAVTDHGMELYLRKCRDLAKNA